MGHPDRALVALVIGRRALEYAALFEWNMGWARHRNRKSKLSGELRTDLRFRRGCIEVALVQRCREGQKCTDDHHE